MPWRHVIIPPPNRCSLIKGLLRGSWWSMRHWAALQRWGPFRWKNLHNLDMSSHFHLSMLSIKGTLIEQKKHVLKKMYLDTSVFVSCKGLITTCKSLRNHLHPRHPKTETKLFYLGNTRTLGEAEGSCCQLLLETNWRPSTKHPFVHIKVPKALLE